MDGYNLPYVTPIYWRLLANVTILHWTAVQWECVIFDSSFETDWTEQGSFPPTNPEMGDHPNPGIGNHPHAPTDVTLANTLYSTEHRSLCT